MENLFVVASADPLVREEAFREGLALARALFGDAPDALAAGAAAKGAVYRRANGTGGGFATDPVNGSWLLAVGTWLHDEGYGAGDEARLLQRYRETGAHRLARELDGFYAIVIGDARTDDVHVLTDGIGSQHAFTKEIPCGLVVSTSSLLLAAIRPASLLDTEGCQEFLATGILYEDRTLHRGVRKVPGATAMRIRHGAVQETIRTWHPADVRVDVYDGDAAVDVLHDSLVAASRRLAAGHERIAADLTGGYDSRAVVGALLCAGIPFSTNVTGPAGHVDVRVAAEVARAAGLDHRCIPPFRPTTLADLRATVPFADGAYDVVEYSSILAVHRELAGSFDLSLNGSNGEIARGRWWEHLVPHAGACMPLDARHIATKRFACERFDASLFAPEDRIDFVEHFTAVVQRTIRGLETLPNTLQMNWVYASMRMQSWQGRIATSTNRLWPVVSPFLLKSVMKPVLGMTPAIRKRSLVVRRFLAEFQPALAAPNTDNGYPPLPFGLRTAHRFAGLPKYYAERAVQKASRLVGRRAPAPQTAGDLPPRFHLQIDPEMRDFLHERSLAMHSIADASQVRGFLARAEQRDFPWSAQWNRLVSIELGMRAIAEARASVSRTSSAVPSLESLPTSP